MNAQHWISQGAVILFIVLSSACIQLDPVASESLAKGAATSATVTGRDAIRPPSADVVNRTIDSPRPEAPNREARRQAEKVLSFFGIRPGMTVLDLYSSGGYYTDLLSSLVGNHGRVVMYNQTPYERFVKTADLAPDQERRLNNVEQQTRQDSELDLPPNAFDAVVMILAYHDVYYVSEETGWPGVDGPKMLATVYASMRPGAVLGIVDHAAARGAPAETGGTLHRLDPDLIKRDIVAAGFLFDGESDVLRNFFDDHSQPVFNDSIRGRSDRVVFRFRKPVKQ